MSNMTTLKKLKRKLKKRLTLHEKGQLLMNTNKVTISSCEPLDEYEALLEDRRKLCAESMIRGKPGDNNFRNGQVSVFEFALRKYRDYKHKNSGTINMIITTKMVKSVSSVIAEFEPICPCPSEKCVKRRNFISQRALEAAFTADSTGRAGAVSLEGTPPARSPEPVKSLVAGDDGERDKTVKCLDCGTVINKDFACHACRSLEHFSKKEKVKQ